MAQIAIPLLLLGTAYLVSNDESDDKEKEEFTNLSEIKNTHDLLANTSNNTFSPNVASSQLNINNEKEVSTFQDKYFLQEQSHTTPAAVIDSGSTFQNMAGNTVSQKDFKHNNMNVFYSSKTNGHNSSNYEGVLDAYTGQGTFEVKKDEVASLFKPEDNMQNVYGSRNQNDFLQSRVNSSHRHANTKPFESIRDTPGIGMEYGQKSELGFNTGAMQRDMWRPKTVDELRAANNPKMTYKLDDHMGPALNPIQNIGVQGKIEKRRPETYFQNDKNLGMIAGVSGAKQSRDRNGKILLAEQNRPKTSVSYYGAKSGGENMSYVEGEYMDAHKQQLKGNPFINLSNNGINPANEQNYGKEGYNALPNNRSTTRTNYFGAIGGLVNNVVQPIFNGLRHTKKTNFVEANRNSGNVTGVVMNPRAVNQDTSTPTTNREMYECKLGMDHLNVQHQDSTGYMNARPLVNETMRSTMNQSEVGPAGSTMAKGNMSYVAEYNQREHNRIHAEDVKSGGNMSLFNSNISMTATDREQCNDRSTPFYNPQNGGFDNPTQLLGEFSSMPQDYDNKINTSSLDSSMLNAFKNNPYTQPLNSVA
jgi:hypothetical protein